MEEQMPLNPCKQNKIPMLAWLHSNQELGRLTTYFLVLVKAACGSAGGP